MGVPKFFRYISERYPCLSELVREHQIPEFDNLYLDMNGIIHTCSHPDDDNPHFRITEEKIFQDIFHYIEVLFRMIKPRKLFFMAIDGVAPRAKMNQQRARRFRSAKDAEKSIEKAMKKGEVLPTEDRFDSNCITPGTIFMAKLHEQLKYFVVSKISTDKLWKNCKVILSGHETPGEGEHKIMDYIRYMKAQPGYDPNTRHCLYGLDADLIMLGLCTHEPHFSLLREEVKFGKKANRKRSVPEETTFFLLHLSLMREYLDMEFKELQMSNQLKFDYDLEKIIDDWVLMGFLVGNDFIPNLPNLHIGGGALSILYKTYMKVLPTFDGYINEAGTLNLLRFEKFMEHLAEFDFDQFQEMYADLKYFEAKTGRKFGTKGNLEEWEDDSDDVVEFIPLEPEKPMDSGLAALIKNTDDMLGDGNDLKIDSLTLDETNSEGSDSEASTISDTFEMEFKQHKTNYYRNKLEYANVTPDVLRAQAEGYVRAIQWNLNYYYNGCCSWSWYYPHHYAPYISDIKGFSDLKIEFELGEPFKPYEQLLAVLPPLSKKLLPPAYHKLMTDEDSVIRSFYPDEFATDLNGKKQEWEAVVLIPFIDEKLLLEAMNSCNKDLSAEELNQNREGPMLIYTHIDADQGPYDAPEYFPTIPSSFAQCLFLSIHDIRVPKEKLIKGVYPGVKQDIYYPGFPTTKHLEYTHRLENIRVRVHEQMSRNESMVLTLKVSNEVCLLDEVAKRLLGKTVYVSWPHLIEALVVSVSDKHYRYHHNSDQRERYNVVENKGNVEKEWQLDSSSIIERYKTRFGIEVGPVSILVHTKVLIGRKYLFTQYGRATLEKQWATVTSPYPLQSVVEEIRVHDDLRTTFVDIEAVFPVGSACFMLSHPCYGCRGTVKDSRDCVKQGRLKICMRSFEEPDLRETRELEAQLKTKYMNSYEASSRLMMSKGLFSRITGTILISMVPRRQTTEDSAKINIGLNLKFSKKNEEVPGYTRKEMTNWLYSQKAVNLVKEYRELWPELFSYMNAHNDSVYYLEDIYQNGDGKEKVSEAVKWIKSQEYYAIERQACGSTLLDPEVVKQLEKTIDEYVKTAQPKIVNLQVKPHVLYKPELQVGNVPPDQNAKFLLYDRVVNVREGYTVPLGLEGTVIAVHKSATGNDMDVAYDVLFDEPFPGGLQLNCSANRGYRLPKYAMICKSYGRRVCQEKAVRAVPKQVPVRDPSATFAPFGGPNVVPPPPRSQPQAYPQIGYNVALPPFHGMKPFFNVPMVFPPNGNGRPMMPRVFAVPPRPAFVDNRNVQQASQPIQIKKPPRAPTQPQSQPEKPQKEAPMEKVNDNHTDFLKQMLKINPTTKHPIEGKSISVDEIFRQHSEASDTEKQNSKFNSVELLKYLQTNGLGVPHYSYFQIPNGKIQAQLVNPVSGNVVIGTPCDDKQAACESVAGEMLKLIGKGKTPKKPLPPQVPPPPKKWTAQNKEPEKKKPIATKYVPPAKRRTAQATQEPPLPNSSAAKSSTSAFVPLQAVRKHLAKHQLLPKENVPDKDNVGGGVQSAKPPNEHDPKWLAQRNATSKSAEGTVTEKPTRSRKMRLAANFDMKPNV